MSGASAIVWAICGSPLVDDCVDAPAGARCWVCGVGAHRAMPRDDWNGATFTGQNRCARVESRWVCQPCVYIHSRLAPVPGRPPAEGKKLGGNFRNYSHLWDELGEPAYQNASKGEKPTILAFLRRPKVGRWFAAIADSGQKHVIPWAPINHGPSGVALFDEMLVTVPADDGGLIDDLATLLTAGATKEEIERGEYQPGAWTRCAPTIRAFEERWSSERGGGWFALALWLAQRDEEAVQARIAEEREAAATKKRAAKAAKTEEAGHVKRKRGAVDPAAVERRAKRGPQDAHDGSDPGVPAGVPGAPRQQRRARTLGAPPVAAESGGENVCNPGGVADGPREGAAPAGPGQLRSPSLR